MSSDSDLKQAVLEAVYEDDRGNPRSIYRQTPRARGNAGHGAQLVAAPSSRARNYRARRSRRGLTWLDPANFGEISSSSSAARDAPQAVPDSAWGTGDGLANGSAWGSKAFAEASTTPHLVEAAVETRRYGEMSARSSSHAREPRLRTIRRETSETHHVDRRHAEEQSVPSGPTRTSRTR